MPWPLIGKLGSIRSAGAEASGQCPIEKTNRAGQGTITDSRQTQTPRDICIGPGELWHSLSCVSFVPQPTQILFRISKNFNYSDILMDEQFMFHFFSFMWSFLSKKLAWPIVGFWGRFRFCKIAWSIVSFWVRSYNQTPLLLCQGQINGHAMPVTDCPSRHFLGGIQMSHSLVRPLPFAFRYIGGIYIHRGQHYQGKSNIAKAS